MCIAPVNEHGSLLFYEDSGVPQGSVDYVTLVLVHGLAFHGGIFKRMLPFAAAHNLRIIAINQRDYVGSSLYTSAELNRITGPDVEHQESALQAQGREIAAFLVHVIKSGGVLQVLQDANEKKTGGLALLGWSLGNLIPLSMFGNAEYLDDETRSTLEGYLRTLVLFDTALHPIGESPPQGLLELQKPDPKATPKDRGNPLFSTPFSAYYTPVPDLSASDESSLKSRADVYDESAGMQNKIPTFSRMSSAELESVSDAAAVPRSGLPLLRIKPDIYRRTSERALFDTKGSFKNVRALVVWGDMSVTLCVWAAKRIAERAEAAKTEGRLGRQVEIVKMEGANHFIHWDEPEYTVQFLAAHL